MDKPARFGGAGHGLGAQAQQDRGDGVPACGQCQPAAGEEVQAYYNRVGPRYFETMGVPIVAGRAIDERDLQGRQLAVVVNETMARTFWPGEDAVGKRFIIGPWGPEPAWATITVAAALLTLLFIAVRNQITLVAVALVAVAGIVVPLALRLRARL